MKIDDYKKQIGDLCQTHDVSRLSIFGSVVTEKFSPASDIDFLVVFQNSGKIKGSFDRYFDLKESLEMLLAKQVDLICENQITNPYLQATIDKTKQLIYAA